ncbi:ribosomal protein S6 kinase-like 1 isoform X2 [Rana temporaria]|uniref:ribosomal protein S6 kinase-like 1 isoform X2 n=1 Tax=Rana temporaria TaxID=8407 RepID=UPI001AAD5A3E|nr:ribosomal protein S6 kinase-like 1 isoform X2 [Rana temporaria]
MSCDRDFSCHYRVIEPTSKPPSKRDYLVDAAKQLHVAQERDANEEYEAAFNHYKHGVELLLSGVTVDPSRERRDAVKRKISQYLKRAEEIFNCHLQRPLGSVGGAAEGYSSLRFRPIRVLSAAVENLKRCQVLQIIDKSLMKSGRSGTGTVTIIPQGVPFMVPLQRFYVSDDSVYLQLQHVKGGRLWDHLRNLRAQETNSRQVPQVSVCRADQGISQPHHELSVSLDNASPAAGVLDSQVRLWAAQLVLALDALHQDGVLCQDLNPRNLLMGEKGEVCLTYFGQWREVDHVCCPEAVENLYVAPEVQGVGPVSEACDWWSLGVLLYEMLCGQSLCRNQNSGLSAHMKIPYPEFLGADAISLLRELLHYEPEKRLGSGPGGAQKIKSHPYFSVIQWNKLV